MPPIDPDFASGARMGTVGELAAALGISESGVWKLRARRKVEPVPGLLPSVRFHLPTVKAKLKVNPELLTPPPVPIIQRRRVVRHKQPRKGAT